MRRRSLQAATLALGLTLGFGCAAGGVGESPAAHQALDELWDFADPAGSAGRFRTAAEGAEGLERLEALTQAARAEGLQRHFAEAFGILAEVDAEVAAAVSDRALNRVAGRAQLERGRLQRDTGDAPAAWESFTLAFHEFIAAEDDALAVDAAHMAGLVAEDATTRLDWTARALRMAEHSEDPAARAWRASLHNNLGWERFDGGEPELALVHFEQGLELRAEAGAEPAWRIARWAVARCLRELGRVDEALLMQRALAADQAAVGEEDGYVFEELGWCLDAFGMQAEAAEQFGEAHRVLSNDAWLAEHEPERLAELAQRAR